MSSFSVRLARRSVVSVGLRSTTPRLLSTLSALSAARRPRLSQSSSLVLAPSSTPFLAQRRNLSDSSASAAAQATASAADASSVASQAASNADVAAAVAANDGALTTVWEGVRTVLMMPTHLVTEALIHIPTPSYLVSIFVLAYVLRTALTLPIQFWQRNRIERLQTIVNPQLAALNHDIAMNTVFEAKLQHWPYPKYVETVKRRMRDAVYALHKKHGTHPWMTLLGPAAVNIPLLIAASWGVRDALVASPEIAQSTALWLQSFGTPDQDGILPIATAILAAANVEIMKRAQELRKKLHKYKKPVLAVPEAASLATAAPATTPPSGVSAHRPEVAPPKPTEKRTKTSVPAPRLDRYHVSKYGKSPQSQITSDGPRQPNKGPKPKMTASALESVTKSNSIFSYAMKDKDRMNKGISNFLTIVAIGIVPVGMWTPSLVVAYWFASMSYTALQTLYFANADRKALKVILDAQEVIAQKSLRGKHEEQARRKARAGQA